MLALNLTGVQWLFLLVFSIVSVLLPLAFYYAGLQLLEPMSAVVASCLEPVFAIAIADCLKDRAERRRIDREHPGMMWTPAGWRPKPQ